VCVVALALAAPARAAPFTPALERAAAAADRYWGTPSNCTSLDRQIVPDGSLPGGADAIATYADAPTPCVLYVERSLARPSQWVRACGVLVHEGGHLRGLDHDFGGVMAIDSLPPPLCFRAGARELNRR
jgi:hypothetical protein